ncbi:MAG: ABC transporter ATP-binding protein [Candidatus Omnitrophica bacterium]|nr:ABC transporter ATP-binding protein [Candidatus Omnitrophota bacterium]
MLLKVKNLTINFKNDDGPVKAVKGIDFEINENEVLGLVGESGSGKTVTALSIMDLLEKKTCCVEGEINTSFNRVRGKNITMVFQEPFTSLNPVLRVGEQVDEVMLTHEKASAKEARSHTLELFRKVMIKEPERVYDSYPHALSGGQRQRVMLAMAISLRPKLLIADEPTTALDVTIQKEILELIMRLKEELGMAVFFITHDFDIIKKIADRVLVMKNGRIVESGLRKSVLSDPKNEYTKKLIDAVPSIGGAFPGKGKKTGEVVLEAKDLTKSFYLEKGFFRKHSSRISAVSEVSLKIHEGRTLGVVGESGCGKTTLARLLVGLLKADKGEVRCPEKNIQIVFQDPASSLDPRMRMGDIVLEGLTIRGAKRREKELVLREILFNARLNYKDRMKLPHEFSGGERQRIAIARSLAVKPRVLILDEPVSSLDVIIQKEVLGLLKDLQKELFLTYVFISHDLRVIEYMSDDVAVIENGRIVELASREKLYESPQHAYTKKLLRSVL